MSKYAKRRMQMTKFERKMKQGTKENRAKSNLNAKMLSKARPYIDQSQPTFLQHRHLRNDDDAYDGIGFDLTQYSIKYVKCSYVETWNDEAAENEEMDGVTIRERFVIFRLCPSATCSDYRQFGCSSNYGEYIVGLEEWLETMQEYIEQKKEDFCDICERCFMEEEEEEKEEEDGDRRRRLEGEADADEAEEAEEEAAEEDEMVIDFFC